MEKYRFSIVIEKDRSGYVAFCPRLPGCYTQGVSHDEAVANLRDAIRLHVLDRLQNGEKIPQAESVAFASLEVPIHGNKASGRVATLPADLNSGPQRGSKFTRHFDPRNIPAAMNTAMAARLIGCTRANVCAAIESGRLRAKRVGIRFIITREAFIEWRRNNHSRRHWDR